LRHWWQEKRAPRRDFDDMPLGAIMFERYLAMALELQDLKKQVADGQSSEEVAARIEELEETFDDERAARKEEGFTGDPWIDEWMLAEDDDWQDVHLSDPEGKNG
jgi:hypothetical protein